MTDDGFLDGRLRIWQPRAGYRAATDPVLLAAAVPARARQSVLELGCGAGVASLCLGLRVSGLAQAGLELQPAYAALARMNAARNALALEVVEGDLAAMPADLRRPFDHVMLNPPYFTAGGGTAAADAGRETAQREATPLAVWVDAAIRRLHPGGHMTLIIGADRLPDVLAGCAPRLGSLAVLPLASRAGRAAGRVIVQGRKGGRAAFRLLAPFVLHDGNSHDGDRDSYSSAAAQILRDGGSFPSGL
nr:methyltransferase [Fertoeibacter niger]